MVTKKRLVRSAPPERRDHILEVARDAFLEQGYGATSMSHIAARLGGSKATLYKYFPSKEQLFEDMMTQSCSVFMATLTEVDAGDGDIEEFLVCLGQRYLRALLAPEAIRLNRLVHAEGYRFPVVAATWFRTGPDASQTLLAERLAAFVEKGVARCPDPRMAAEQFLGMLRGDLVMRVVCGVEQAPSDVSLITQVGAAARVMAASLRQV